MLTSINHLCFISINYSSQKDDNHKSEEGGEIDIDMKNK